MTADDVQGMIHGDPDGAALPDIRTPVPGPRSRALGARLRAVESRNITQVGDTGPIFWGRARGANVEDVDGNTFVDLTAGFGVAAAGHAHPAVVGAICRQSARLVHALGDVHPADVKVELLERLASLAPGDLSVAILSANGSDAVESAWKTAMLATGRPGVVAFRGGYHGLGLGALALTSGDRFRAPFMPMLNDGVRFAPYPDPAGPVDTDAAMGAVREQIRAGSERGGVGAVVVEPILGRGGIIVPPDDFLPALRALCTEMSVLLVLDEVYTGIGRTGRWFACDHHDVVPDLLVVGKSLAGGLPLSAVIGSPEVMASWPASEGEAIHTSTFLGNPVACAAALAHLRVIEDEGLVDRAAELGGHVLARAESMASGRLGVAGGRGRGLMQAVVLEGSGERASARAIAVAEAALRRGVIVLSEGGALAVTPPLTITRGQLDVALDVIEEALTEVA